MKQEIGFVHLAATILTSGIIETDVVQTKKYNDEKYYVQRLLDSYSDIENIEFRSRATLVSLINEALRKWWASSWFNVQIDMYKNMIMNMLEAELLRNNVTVCYRSNKYIVVEDLYSPEYILVQQNLRKKIPTLKFWYRAI